MKGTVRPDFSVVSKQTRTESRHFLTENTQIIQHKQTADFKGWNVFKPI